MDEPVADTAASTAVGGIDHRQRQVSGTTAAILRQLAVVEGRSPEELAMEWATGALVVPGRPIGENPEFADWGTFDGPPDLSSRVDELMRAQAQVLRTLALLEGRTPEQVALDRIARGIPLVFDRPIGEDPRVMEALSCATFDGPPDLAERSRRR